MTAPEDQPEIGVEPDGSGRLSADNFIDVLKTCYRWRIWNDVISGEFVMAAQMTEGGQVRPFKGPDPATEDKDTVLKFMFAVAELMGDPEVESRKA